MKHPIDESYYWSKDFLLICLSNMLIFLSFQLLLPTLPIYLTDNGSDKSTIGMITAIITFAAVLIRFFTGYALDHFNRRPIVISGSVVLALGAISFSFAPIAGLTIMSSLLLGIGWGIMTVAYATIVSDLIPPGRQGSGMGTFMFFGMVSMALGPFIGGWLYAEYGPQVLFGAACLISLLSLLLVLPNGVGKTKKGVFQVEQTSGKYFVLTAMFEKTSLFPALLILLFTVCYGGIISFAGLLGKELGLSNGGVFFLLSSAASILVRPVAGKTFDTKGHAAVILPGIVIGIVSFFTLSMATDLYMFVLAAVLYGLSFGAVQPYLLAWTIQRTSPTRRGAANSTFLIGMDTGIALGSIMLGYLSQAWGYASIFLASTLLLIMLLAIYSVSLLTNTRSRSSEETGDQVEEDER